MATIEMAPAASASRRASSNRAVPSVSNMSIVPSSCSDFTWKTGRALREAHSYASSNAARATSMILPRSTRPITHNARQVTSASPSSRASASAALANSTAAALSFLANATSAAATSRRAASGRPSPAAERNVSR